MSTTRDSSRTPAWSFRREVTLGNLLHLMLLAVMAIAAWTNLQKELALIRHDLNQLVTSSKTSHQHMERLNSQCVDHEYRLKTLEKQTERVEHKASNMDLAATMVHHGSSYGKGDLLWVREK